MSIQAVAFVLDTHVPEVAAKMLLVCLANAHNQSTGLCCPSVARLAEESSMSRRSVQRWLKWLTENGLIETIGTSDDSGRQQSNEYRIVGFVRGAKLTPSPNGRGDTADTGEGVTGVTLGGVTGGTPLKKPEENRKKEREQADARISFEEIWKAFPRRRMTNRTEAEAEFAKLADDETHRCLTAAKRFHQWHIEDAAARNETAEKALEFRMGLAKWLRTEAWIAALTISLANDPVPVDAVTGWVYLAADHPDFQAVERMLGKKLTVHSAGGKRGFRIEEIEQARAQMSPSAAH
ncbi:MAG: helix-turn-helix domain-containing protein [Devosia sp.]|uniref:helix-turn-helix domain-containing protein n=1 Tax=Devosia sp. TaxID=1871048 RepID=UPI003399C80C